MIGFGLDPAGYCNGRSVLAVAKRRGLVARVEILRNCPFSKVPEKSRELDLILANERAALQTFAGMGRVAIDVPIDLQALPTVRAPTYLWQETKRSVDKAVEGMEPLASSIGHVTARFQSIFCEDRLNREIGSRIFETYPKPSLKKLLGDDWANVRRYKDKKDTSHIGTICNALNISPRTEIKSHDDLDAVICSLTAIALDNEIWSAADYRELAWDVEELPRGYRLLARNPFNTITVSTACYSEWMQDSSKTQ
ncbi:MAG: DUF429 domain-containing protein [Xanthobacteraceae bacterium]